MKARSPNGKKIHNVTFVGDIGFGLYRVITDCRLQFDDWIEVVVKEATCIGCQKGKRK